MIDLLLAERASPRRPIVLLRVGLLAGVAASKVATALPSQAVTLDTVRVSVDRRELSQAEAAERIPGAVNLIDADALHGSRLAGIQDLLAYQPGIYAQSPGNEGVKLSIRGSGINRAPGAHASGVYVSLDGLPLTGPGGTPYELLEPLWLSRAEVLRGANAIDRGGLALGGAIDYVSRSGRDSLGPELHYETGSRGYLKRAAGYGGAQGAFDYYLAYADSRYDGYQYHAAGDGQGALANLGWQVTPDLDTRLYLRYRQTDHLTPGRLTRAQIRGRPRAANTGYVALDARRLQPGSHWIGSTTTLRLDDDSTLKAGLVYHHFPMDLNESLYRQRIDYADLNGSLDYRRRHTLFGKEAVTTLGLRVAHDLSADAHETLRFARNDDPAGTRTRDYLHSGTDAVLHAANALTLVPGLRLVSGLALVHTRRQVEVTWPASGERLAERRWDYAPRLGLTWQVAADTQLFGNLSRSVEPPHPWSMLWSSNRYFTTAEGAAAGRQRGPVALDNQTATTLELGSRGDSLFGRWELTGYWSQVRHELLSVEVADASGSYIAESNAGPTVHRGIEASLDGILRRGEAGRLSLRQAYTFSDFRFRHGRTFGGNRLPGLPRHYWQGELRYDHRSGLYAALDSEYASKMAVDYANSYWADGHLVFGTRLGFEPSGRRWQGWLELRNLTDRRYAATVTPGYDDAGEDLARSTPGEGFSVYAGISWRLH